MSNVLHLIKEKHAIEFVFNSSARQQYHPRVFPDHEQTVHGVRVEYDPRIRPGTPAARHVLQALGNHGDTTLSSRQLVCE